MKETKKKSGSKSTKTKTTSKTTKVNKSSNATKTKKVVKVVKVEEKPKVEEKVVATVQKTEKVITTSNIKFNEIFKWSKLGFVVLGFILIVLGFIFSDNSVILQFCGVSLAGLAGVVHVSQSEKYPLVKSLGIMLGTAILMTWFIPSSAFNGAELVEYEVTGVGITDLSTIFYYSIYFALDKLIFLFMIGLFYGVLSKVNAYSVLTSKIANSLVAYKKIVVISAIVLMAIMTGLFSQTLAVVLFVPFFYTILTKMKIDKMTVFISTFGAILAGAIGAPWGTEGLSYFTQYTQIPFTSGFEYRVIIALSALALFILFAILRLKGINTENNLEVAKDPFEIEESTEKINIIPISIVLGLTAVLAILGFVNWQTYFEITIFNDFHLWLLELMIGETAIFADLLGSTAKAFGLWDLLIGIVLVFVMTILVGVSSRIEFSKFVDGIVKGFKVVSKPAILAVLVFIVFIVSYMTPFMANVTNYFFNLTVNLEPNLTAVAATFSSIFHPDFGYTGYIVGPYLSVMYAEQLPIVSVIFTSMYGLVQVFAPTSLVLMIGLSYSKVSYKEYLKSIWMFALGILAVTLVLINVLYYIA